MNNTLNINRLGKTLKHDGLNYFPNMGLTLAILFAIPVVYYLFVSLMPGEEDRVVDAFSRITFITILTKVALILAPARLYRYCNDPRKGIGYAMLPASTLEKFISMLFYCVIVTPILYIAGALAIDSILALFNGPYDEFAATYFFDNIAQMTHAIAENSVFFEDADLIPMMISGLTPAFIIFLTLLNYLTVASIFMFGNMIFKKRKTGKMIGILILLFIIFSIVLTNYMANHEEFFEMFNEDNTLDILKRLVIIIMNVMMYVEIVISALMLFGVYRKIKTQKY